MSTEPYNDPRSVELAIKDAAKARHAADPSVSVNERIRQAHFDRLLCRVFSEGAMSEWVLKGGTGMLARIPDSRSTKDIDLFATGYTLDQALAALRRLASVNLGDHFRFEYLSHAESVDGEQQPYTDGYRVTFQTFLGTKKVSDIGVDLVVSVGDLASVDIIEPAYRLALPRLVTHPYRLYPVERQIADKVCATMATYSGRPSSREKDLVDLVVIANTHTVNAESLRRAITQEAALRGLDEIRAFSIPDRWGRTYEQAAKSIQACSGYERIDQAKVLMNSFLGADLLQSTALGAWSPASRSWLWETTDASNAGGSS